MIDLPLGSPDPDDGPLPGLEPEALGVGGGKGPRGQRRRRRVRRRLDRKKAGLLLLLLGVVATTLFIVLWPKPAQVAFSPLEFAAGNQRVSTRSVERVITVSNIGERIMPVSMVMITEDPEGEFEIIGDSCAGHDLAPAQSCVVELVFAPRQMGERRAALEIHAEMPDSPARLDLVGMGIGPLARITPESLEFGPQDVGTTSSSRLLTIANEGTAQLELEGFTISGSGGRDFRRTRDECSDETLAPGAQCAVGFTFAPRAGGRRSFSLSVESDSLIAPPEVGISGEGIWTGAAFSVDPKSVDFGDHRVGSSPALERVSVTNRQGSSLPRLAVSLTGSPEALTIKRDRCAGAVLSPGDMCTVEVEFKPVAEGEFVGLLEIGDRKEGVFGLEIKGRAIAPRWILDATSLDLGSVRVQADSDPARVVLRNEGTAAATIDSVSIEGPDAKLFRLRDRCSGRSLVPDTGCEVEVLFSGAREGRHRAELRFEPDFGAAPGRVGMTALAVAPRLGLDLELVEFGQVHRTTRREVLLTASNLGTATLEISALSVDGEAAESFRILGGTCFPRAAVPAQRQCTIRLGFDPLEEGRGTAMLRIEHDGITGPRAVPLAGTGLPPPAPEIYFSTKRIEFGPQAVDERSPILTLNVNAAGTGRLRLLSFEIVGEDRSSFQVVPATCQAAPDLLPGTSCSVGVRMIPSRSGPQVGILEIRHNAASRVSRIELRGEGLGGGP